MKKHISTMAIIVLIASIIGCGGEDTVPESGTAPLTNTDERIGLWMFSSPGNPFAGAVVYLNNTHYYMTQGALGANGYIGGVELSAIGSFDTNEAFDAQALINTNWHDSAVGANLEYNASTPDTLIVNADINLTRIESTGLAGAWVTNITANGSDFSFSILLLDGNGTYQVADIDSSHGAESFTDDTGTYKRANMFELGDYNVTGQTITFTPHADTNATLIADTSRTLCTDGDIGDGCGVVAGDSNLNAGFSDPDGPVTSSFTFSTDTNTITFTDINATLYRVVPNGLTFDLP